MLYCLKKKVYVSKLVYKWYEFFVCMFVIFFCFDNVCVYKYCEVWYYLLWLVDEFCGESV